MTAIDFSVKYHEDLTRYDILGALRAGWQAFARRRQERRAIVAISRLAPHVIRDMGFEPEEIYGALNGTWDEVDPVNFRILLPRESPYEVCGDLRRHSKSPAQPSRCAGRDNPPRRGLRSRQADATPAIRRTAAINSALEKGFVT